MQNKRILKGLALRTLISNTLIDSVSNENNTGKTFEYNKDKFNIKNKNIATINKNTVKDSALEIALSDNEYVPDLIGNPNGYESIKIITLGNKKLSRLDYDNLRNSGISNIDLSESIADFVSSFSNAKHLKTFKFPKGIASIDSFAFSGCDELSGELIIPESVKSIGACAFNMCSRLTGDLIIPRLVTNIGNSAFYGCSGLNGKLIISNSVNNIGRYAFYGCNGLIGDLVLPKSITNIEVGTFSGCSSLTGDLIIPKSVVNIDSSAFSGCYGLNGKLIIPNSVINIGDYAFSGCANLTGELNIPESVIKLGSNAFFMCSGFTGKLTISSRLTDINDYTFYNCRGLTGKLVIPSTIKSIGNNAFSGCIGLIGELIIPNSIENIGYGSFYNCRGLTGNILIPSTLNSVGANAFSGCSNIDNIFVKINNSNFNDNYKKDVVDNLPDTSQTIIDVPHDFDIAGTWIETTNKTIEKPIIKNIVNGVENDLINNSGEGISLYMPSLYQKSNMKVLKNGNLYTLPTKDLDGKYIFSELGTYEVLATTSLGDTSVIRFEVKDFKVENKKHANIKVRKNIRTNAETIKKDLSNTNNYRNLLNKLPESYIKYQLQDKLNFVYSNLSMENKSTSANLDVYIKPESVLSNYLIKNKETFDDSIYIKDIEDLEKQDILDESTNSLPASTTDVLFKSEIQNNFNTRNDIVNNNQSLNDIINDLVLNKKHKIVNNNAHNTSLKLPQGFSNKVSVYKSVMKFDV